MIADPKVERSRRDGDRKKEETFLPFLSSSLLAAPSTFLILSAKRLKYPDELEGNFS